MLLSHYTIENKKEHAKGEKGKNWMDKAILNFSKFILSICWFGVTENGF